VWSHWKTVQWPLYPKRLSRRNIAFRWLWKRVLPYSLLFFLFLPFSFLFLVFKNFLIEQFPTGQNSLEGQMLLYSSGRRERFEGLDGSH
jgi:hypothetical protein